MLTATQLLGTVLSSSHGPSSFSSTTASPVRWAPRARRVVSSKRSRTRVSLSEASVNGQATVGTVADADEVQAAGLLTHHEKHEFTVMLKATVTLRLNEEWSTTEKVADMAHRSWLYLEFFSSELNPRT